MVRDTVCDRRNTTYESSAKNTNATHANTRSAICRRLFCDVIAIMGYAFGVMSPLLEEAQRVHDVAGLSDRTIAAATGAKPSTVRGWLAGRSEPTGARAERLIELAEMIRRLARVVRPESIALWLNRPILALDDEKPIELIARGEYRRVAKLIAEIEYPGVS